MGIGNWLCGLCLLQGSQLSNGRGFYHPIRYVLECHRLGIELLPPFINQPSPIFKTEGKSIRVPVRYVKGLTKRTKRRGRNGRARWRIFS